RSIVRPADPIVLRADRWPPDSIRSKLAGARHVETEAVVSCVDAPSIYAIPKGLHAGGPDVFVIRSLNLPFRDVDWTRWDWVLERVHHPAHEVTIGIVGKYIDLPDAYLSVTEALRHGGFANDAKVRVRWIQSDECDTP